MIRRPPRSPLFPYPPLFESIFAGISIISLSALPVHETSPGHFATRLGTTYKNDPVLGIVSSLHLGSGLADRKSTRLNSSHLVISYAVFCLKKNPQHVLDSIA